MYTHTHSGVYLSLKGVVYANNSLIPITEIGETNTTSNTGLQCITDRMPCCGTQGSRAGEWYFPDGTTVPTQGGGATTFYRNRGDDGTVNLNRLNTNVEMPYGTFCCAVPGNIRLCASISKTNLQNFNNLIKLCVVSIRIVNHRGDPIPGQNYSLSCNVSGVRASNFTLNFMYQWMKGSTMLSEMGPILSLSSLMLSDAGILYRCGLINPLGPPLYNHSILYILG